MTNRSEAINRRHARVALALRHLAVGTLLLLLGTATAQNPCEGRGACDALLINKGRAWGYQVGIHAAPRALSLQTPPGQEQALHLFSGSAMLSRMTGTSRSAPPVHGQALLPSACLANPAVSRREA